MKLMKVAPLVLMIALLAVFGCGKKEPPPEIIEAPPEDVVEQVEEVVEEVVEEASPEPLILSDIHFDFDKHALRADAKAALDNNVRQLKGRADVRVIIEGHCDERGTVEYNLALGDKRARAAMEYMVQHGVALTRISVVSYGEERPLDPRHSEKAWSKNRRAHFVAPE